MISQRIIKAAKYQCISRFSVRYHSILSQEGRFSLISSRSKIWKEGKSLGHRQGHGSSRARGVPLTQLENVPEHFEKVSQVKVSMDLMQHKMEDLELMSSADILILGSGLTGLGAIYQILKSTTRLCLLVAAFQQNV